MTPARAAAGLLAAALALCAAGAAEARLAIGDVPPDDLGVDRDGKPLHVSDFRGKIVVVSFWASWCGYCRKELPVLAGLQDVAGRDRVQVVAVNTFDEPEVYRAIRRNFRNVTLTIARDTGAVGKAYDVRAIPHLLIIDRSGRVSYQMVGYGEESLDGIVAEINRQLAATTD